MSCNTEAMSHHDKDPIGAAIAELIRQEFTKSAITEPQLAELTGIPQQSINRVLKGQPTNITRSRALAQALGLDHFLLEAQAINSVESVLAGTKERFGLVAHDTPGVEGEQEATEANQP